MAVTLRESSKAENSSSSIIVNKPTGTVEGDLIIVWYGQDGTGGDLSPPDGTWTEFAIVLTEFNMSTKIWHKTAGGSEPSTYTFTSDRNDNNILISSSYYESEGLGTWTLETDFQAFIQNETSLEWTETVSGDNGVLIIGWSITHDRSVSVAPSGMTQLEFEGGFAISSTAYYQLINGGSISKTLTWSAGVNSGSTTRGGYFTNSATPGAEGTNMQINIGDTWKEVPAIQINIGDTWKEVVSVKQNIGDVWKEVF